jgi:hypothetical protein
MKMDNITEGLAELAGVAERDHEVQMARAELYKIAKYAIKLHEMLKSVSEAEGIEGWQQSKITKAADYMGSVYHAMDYDNKFADGDTDLKASNTSSSEVNGAAKGHQSTWAGGSSFSEARSSASDQAAKAGAYNGGKSIGKQSNLPQSKNQQIRKMNQLTNQKKTHIARTNVVVLMLKEKIANVHQIVNIATVTILKLQKVKAHMQKVLRSIRSIWPQYMPKVQTIKNILH